MPFPRIGLGGVLTLDDKPFVQASGRARDEMGRFIAGANRIPPVMGRVGLSVGRAGQQMAQGIQRIGKGVNQLNAGLRNAAMGALPLTLAVGAGVAQAATFEKQMSAVGSITRANEEDMGRLTKEARRMGIVSVFSATQSGEAMEFMARAGADTTQIISGLQGVMDAAAADSIDLATSADIVSQVVKGMGKDFSEATHIADVLALTSASANTNIISLGESFKFGVSQANAMGISLEETSAIFGKLADAGLRGSLGGTAFTNMLIKLAKPSKKGADILDEFGVKLTEADGSMRKISSIVADFNKELQKNPDAIKRAEMATEVFGIRGQRAFMALAAAGKASIDELETSLISSSMGVGAAAEMAEKRLDNFLGALTLFGASVESVSIGMFTPLLQEFTPVIREMTEGLNAVLFSLDAVQSKEKENERAIAQTSQAVVDQARAWMMNSGATESQAFAAQKHLNVLARQAMAGEALTEAEAKQREAARTGLQEILRQTQNLSRAEADRLAASIEHSTTNEAIATRGIAALQARIQHQQHLQEVEREHGRTAMLIAKGIQDAIDDIKFAWNETIDAVKRAGEAFRRQVGEARIQQIVRIATTVGVIGAALAPVILGLGAFGFVVSGVATAFTALGVIASGVFTVISGVAALALAVFWPVVTVVGALGLAFAFIRRENESIGETVTRVWGAIKTAALSTYDTAIRPFIDGFMRVFVPMLEVVRNAWSAAWASISATFTDTVSSIRASFLNLVGDWGFGTEGMATDWAALGSSVAMDAVTLMTEIIGGFGFMVRAAIKAMDALWSVLKAPFVAFDTFTTLVFDGILKFMEGDFMGGVDRIAVALFDTLTAPFRALAEGVGKLANLIPGLEDVFPTEIKGMGDKLFPELFPTEPDAQRQALAVAEKGAEKIGEQQASGVEAATGFDFGVGANLAAAVAEMADVSRSIADLKAREKAGAAATPKTEVKVALEDKRQLDITNKMCVEGEALNVASARHRQEVQERAGFKATPWQRRIALEQGAVTV